MNEDRDEDARRAAARPVTGPSVGAPRRRRRGLAVAAGAVACSLVLASCRASAVPPTEQTQAPERANTGLVESSEAPKMGGNVAYGLPSETNGWNPATNQWTGTSWMVARTLFDNLAAFDQDAKVHPYFATAIDHNADFTEWTMKLRTGVNYSDGSPVTAESVARAQRALKASPVTQPVYSMVRDITAQSADTVKFSLTQTWTNFPTLMTTQVGVVAEPAWIESNDGLKPVGTGPFHIDTWTVGKDLAVKKNPSYWQMDSHGNRYPYLDSIDFRLIADAEARSSALAAGDVDAIQVGEPSLMLQLREEEDQYQVYSSTSSETGEVFVMLNTQKAPFDDIDARMALAYATDRDSFVDVMENGVFPAADGPFAKNSPWYSEAGYPSYDPVKAKELVEKVKAKNGGTFSFTLSGQSLAIKGLQMLQQMYTEVGIDVKVDIVSVATAIIKAVTGDFQSMQFAGFFYAHPDSEMGFIDPDAAYPVPKFSLNFTRNADPKVKEQIDRFRAATEIGAQKQAMGDLVRAINANVPYIWLYHAQTAVVASKRLVNLTNYTLPDGAKGLDIKEGSHPMHQVWIKG